MVGNSLTTTRWPTPAPSATHQPDTRHCRPPGSETPPPQGTYPSRGRIVFHSSIAGKVSYPLYGAYSASKFAIEAFATRYELSSVRGRLRSASFNQSIDTEMSSFAGGLVD